jgi:hypothetical protein
MKYYLQMTKMLLFIFIVCKNIIKVNNNKSTNKRFKHIIHHPRESNR